MSAANIIPFRSRSEVSRAVVHLPPKSRRRYKRKGGPRYRDVGRFQKPARWYVMGKVILPDLRPCWRCTLGADACATCTNPRRADGLTGGCDG